jgi:hypothetical protein
VSDDVPVFAEALSDEVEAPVELDTSPLTELSVAEFVEPTSAPADEFVEPVASVAVSALEAPPLRSAAVSAVASTALWAFAGSEGAATHSAASARIAQENVRFIAVFSQFRCPLR